jgi:hypothetical protein
MSRRVLGRTGPLGAATAVCWALSAMAWAAGASALPTTVRPWLKLELHSQPSVIPPGTQTAVDLTASNLGDATLQASAEHPVQLTLTLPPGWSAGSSAKHRWPQHGTIETQKESEEHCKTSGRSVICEVREPLAPYEQWEVGVSATVPSEVPAGDDIAEASASGGEGPGTPLTGPSTSRALSVSGLPAPFGLEQFGFEAEDENGAPVTQAGAHPFQLTTVLNLNIEPHTFHGEGGEQVHEVDSGGFAKELRVNLPPGFVGDTRAVPQCSDADFDSTLSDGQGDRCPPDTALGATSSVISEVIFAGRLVVFSPVYNLVPAKGEPARLGFSAGGFPITLRTTLDGGDYHVVTAAANIPEALPLLSSTLTIWGNPGDPRHDSSRGEGCLVGGAAVEGLLGPPYLLHCEPPAERPSEAFLTMPTQCEYALQANVEALSWTSTTGFLPPVSAGAGSRLTGCESVPFDPAISLQPDEHAASTPTGIKSVLKVPQGGTTGEGAIGEADLRDTVVKLPAGVQLNPSSANGLASCSEAAVGLKRGPGGETLRSPAGTIEFENEEPREESASEQAAREAAGTLCPAASKVGTVRLKTPLLASGPDEAAGPATLHGNVYLAAQEENPFGSLFALYIVIKDPRTGVDVKLAGEVHIDPENGEIETSFRDSPQAPFEEFEIELFKGPRASVSTPSRCGTSTTQAALAPWTGTAAVTSFPEPAGLEWAVTSGPGGAPCASPQPFAPSVTAGTGSVQAGADTGFQLTLVRNETDQQPTSLTVRMPPGLAGYLKNVEQCPEPQASLGTCGPRSLIGSARAVTGLGSDPYTVEGGRVYITGPYDGAPFGLSVVIPAAAGPFDFGNVVTRATIAVDPTTAQITIASQLPTMVNTTTGPHGGKGIETGAPVQLRRVEINIPERPVEGKPFQFNPTNCSPQKIISTLTGNEGASASVETPFEVKGCDALQFSPQLSAEVEQHWTKTEGTTMKIVVKAHEGQANIGRSKILFPAQLPSRLTTIQKACLETTFAANPASCPEGSNIGTGTAVTPLLNHVLTGPAYLVSHGNAAFPDVEFVLQGEGITLILDGKTDIKGPHGEPCAESKTGCITSSTFDSVPDAPVSTFTVTLPRGPHSAFTGYGNLCAATKAVTSTRVVRRRVGTRTLKVKRRVTKNVSEKLVLPTVFIGQNDDTYQGDTPLVVTGCKAVAPYRATKKSRKKAKKKPRHR